MKGSFDARRMGRLFLGIHLLICIAIYLFLTRRPPPVWTGSVFAFAIPTIQFTWSFTVGLIVGPRQTRRAWYLATLLLTFIPLWFVCLTAWLLSRFLPVGYVVCWLLFALGVLVVETFAGIYYGIICHIMLDNS